MYKARGMVKNKLKHCVTAILLKIGDKKTVAKQIMGSGASYF
jgi:hypothetical protein